MYNPGDSGMKVADSNRWGADQVYYGGYGTPDGYAHGHYNPNTGYDRPAGHDMIGWTAIYGASGRKCAGLG